MIKINLQLKKSPAYYTIRKYSKSVRKILNYEGLTEAQIRACCSNSKGVVDTVFRKTEPGKVGGLWLSFRGEVGIFDIYLTKNDKN